MPTCRTCFLALALLALLPTSPSSADEEPPAPRPRPRIARRPPLRMPEGIRVERDLTYATVGEKTLKLDLYLPVPSEVRPPLIVWIHGGGWRSGSRRACRLAWLAPQGFAVASIDYRLTHEATFPAQIHDCKGALRWLRANAATYGYDAEHVGVGGSSAGGHLAALLGTSGGVAALEGTVGGNAAQSSRIDAVYDLFGPTDLMRMGRGKTGHGPSAIARLLGGPVTEKAEVARAASPVTHVTADDPPFLIAHGARDKTVPVEESRRLDERLDTAGIESTLHVLEEAGHGGPGFQGQGMEVEVLAFFRRHLLWRKKSAPARPITSVEDGPIARYARPGRYTVASRELFVLRDETRGKDLQVRLTWPDGDGRFPLIVWSHGARGTKDAYQPLVRHWASHGYVLIQANHADSRALGMDRGTRIFRHYADRAQDITFLIDSLDALRQAMQGFGGTVDAESIGVGGHSFGAHTAQLVGGVVTRSVGETGPRSHTNPRVDACLLVSPQGRGDLLDEKSWKHFDAPALIITGTRDAGRNGQPFTWRTEPFSYAPPGNKVLALIEGARHAFGGISGARRFSQAGAGGADQVDAVRALGLLFWDAYLKGREDARGLLRSDAIGRETKRKVRVSHK